MKLEKTMINLGTISTSDTVPFTINWTDWSQEEFHYTKVDCSCTRIVSFDESTGTIKGEVVGSAAGKVGQELDKFVYIYEGPDVPYYKAGDKGKMVVNSLKKRHKFHIMLELEE